MVLRHDISIKHIQYCGLTKCTLQSFPIGEQELISKAKQVFETSSGQKDPSVLADNFRMEFPIVSLGKEVTLTFNPPELQPPFVQTDHTSYN